MSKVENKRIEPSPFGDDVVLIDNIPVRAVDVGKTGGEVETAHFTFDSGGLDGWNTTRLVGGHSATVQGDVVRTGQYAARFELRKNDYASEGARAELRDWFNAPLEKEIWYGLSIRLPADFPVEENIGCVLAQWHDQAKLGDPSGKPPIAIRYKAGRLFVTGAYSPVASHDPDNRYEFFSREDFALAEWSDFIFRVVWSRHGESEIDAWLNGVEIFRFRGKLGYENETVGPYFKMGMYCHGPLETPHIAYHDNYSRGKSYEEVDPSCAHKGLYP